MRLLLTLISLIFCSFLYGEQTKQMSPEEIKQAKQKMVEINKKVSTKVSEAIQGTLPPAVYERYMSRPIMKIDLVEPTKNRTYGNRTAKYKLVVLSDFACSHCKVASKELKARVDENKNMVNLTYVFYPLDTSCNPYMKGKLSDYSCLSTKLALCGEEQKAVWPVMDFLYENQNIGNTKPFDKNSFVKKMEKELGLKDLNGCLKSDRLKQRLKQENYVYRNIKIPGTPFVTLNNRELGSVFKYQQSFGDFIKYLDLKEHPKGK